MTLKQGGLTSTISGKPLHTYLTFKEYSACIEGEGECGDGGARVDIQKTSYIVNT